jgi:hypothetical protein
MPITIKMATTYTKHFENISFWLTGRKLVAYTPSFFPASTIGVSEVLRQNLFN